MKKEKLRTTTNSRVYKILNRKMLDNNEGLCPICGPHSGCNFWKKHRGLRNWKEYRKTQWRDTQVGEGDSLLNC
jgi:hypothetical protein